MTIKQFTEDHLGEEATSGKGTSRYTGIIAGYIPDGVIIGYDNETIGYVKSHYKAKVIRPFVSYHVVLLQDILVNSKPGSLQAILDASNDRYRYAAIDAGGSAYLYNLKPNRRLFEWDSWESSMSKVPDDLLDKELLPDWKNSLAKRTL